MFTLQRAAEYNFIVKLQQKYSSAGQIVSTGKSQFYLESVIGPAPKLHLTALVVEGEPGDVDLAGGLEHAGRDVGAEARARHNHVCGERRVKALAGAVTFWKLGLESQLSEELQTNFQILKDWFPNLKKTHRIHSGLAEF